MSEKQVPILMDCRLSVRYEVNQLRTMPDTPYHVDKRGWVSAVTLPLSTLSLFSLCTFKRAVFLWSETVCMQTSKAETVNYNLFKCFKNKPIQIGK